MVPDQDSDEGDRPTLDAADAATTASRDALAVAIAAADTTVSAREAVTATGDVVSNARDATASIVAAAALAAAEIAAEAASSVQAAAAARALDVAQSAVAALETIAADRADGAETEAARKVAALVAETVAAEVIAQAKLTDDAAARVARAVMLAAEAATLSALAAASLVESAAAAASSFAHRVAGSSAATELASDIAVESTARAATLALDRVALIRQQPKVVELRHALEAQQLRLHYQPMYSLGTGSVVGMEALLRWEHPDRGLLMPAEFLEIAEGPQLVTPVGDWVLETAISQASRWQQAFGRRAPVVWVNVSCDQLGRHHLTEVVDRLLSEAEIMPGLLGIEVTERQLARRVNDVASDLLELREMGVALAVDDFGTGYASLDYLRRFTFDEIKIDRSFVSGLDDRTNVAVTSSIITLAQSLGLTAVGEGVETKQQYDRLSNLGCAVAQGYLLHRPAPADVVTDALTDTGTASAFARAKD